MESVSFLRFAIALVTLIGLLAGFAWLLKYFAARGWVSANRTSIKNRLGIVETLPLDARRRLVIVRCDNNEHLLLLGANQDLIIDKLSTQSSKASS